MWRLLDGQVNALTDFLLSPQPSPSSPFPILASDDNLHRHDPWDAIALHHIFRDPWERKIAPTKPDDGRDVRSTGDYPELAVLFTKLNEAWENSPLSRMDEQPYNVDLLSRLQDSNENETGHPEQRDNSADAEETCSLYGWSPTRSLYTADVDSLHIKTPPESPALRPTDDRTGLAAPTADTGIVPQTPAQTTMSQESTAVVPECLIGDSQLLTDEQGQGTAQGEGQGRCLPPNPCCSGAPHTHQVQEAGNGVLGKRKMKESEESVDSRSSPR